MQVERRFEQVKDRWVLIELPDSFNNHLVEIIILTDDAQPAWRCPHSDIAGQLKIHGDIFSSVPETDWDLPR